jgi:hypothetical protein
MSVHTINAAVAQVTVAKRRRAFWVDCLIAVIAILPLLLTAHLPLTDLPNHLARQYILRDWSNSTALQSFYLVHWALVPNLALEFFILAARPFMSLDIAMRLFCIVTVLMLFIGTRQVNRALSDGAATAYRLVPLICYGGPFQFGFLSYCFGIGLAVVAFGWYLRLRPVTMSRLVLFMPLSFVLLLCHLAAFGLFAFAVGGCELAVAFQAVRRDWRRLPGQMVRRQIGPFCCFVPVFLLFLLLSPTADPNAAAENAVRFSTVHDKVRSLASITMFTQPKLEVGLLALALAGFVAALLLRAVRVHIVMLVVVPVMLLAWLALPQIAVHTAFIDYRLPWAIAFFLLAGVVPGPHYARYVPPMAAGFGILTVARVALISFLWLRWEPTLAAIDQALSNLPPGIALAVVEGRPPTGGVFRDPDLSNVAAYAVARRQAFEPGMFASFAGQILDFRGRALTLWQQDGQGAEIPDKLDSIAPDYRYVLVLLPELARVSSALPLACAATGPHFQLLRVVPPSEPGPHLGC